MRLLREQDALLHTHCISRALFPFPPYVGDTPINCKHEALLTRHRHQPNTNWQTPKTESLYIILRENALREHVQNPDKPLENRGLETNA